MQFGFTLLPDVPPNKVPEALSSFGTVVPQYNGTIHHEVRSLPGNERLRYSASSNSIGLHTEAPGLYEVPPKYLALFCRTQAQCGGGHTDLLDARVLHEALPRKLQEAVTKRSLTWPGPSGVQSPLLSEGVWRFSYNLLTTGSYDPPIDSTIDPHELPLGRLGIEIAEISAQCFARKKTAVLIPENAILVWDNHRFVHARSKYSDGRRHLTRYWLR